MVLQSQTNLSIAAGVCPNVPALVVVVAGTVDVAPQKLNHIVVIGTLLPSPHLGLSFLKILFDIFFLRGSHHCLW